MRVVLCWGGVSGYMAACWKRLAERPGIDLLVLNPTRQNNAAFDDEVMSGLNHRLLARTDYEIYADAIRQHRADVVGLSGWMYPAFLRLAAAKEFASIPFVMNMDTPLRTGWRQRLGRLKLRGYFNRMSCVIVPGERAWQYARFLGFQEHRIHRGLYGVDYESLCPLLEMRTRQSQTIGDWPRNFLFLGRYIHEKGVDILLAAYRKYRGMVTDPWPLTCCGMGPMKSLLTGEQGVEDCGFVQPARAREMMRDHGVLVLPSRFDPWPLVIVEACAAGMPVVCSQACGSAVEVVRDGYNGFTAASNDVDSLATALKRAQDAHAELGIMGKRAQQLAAPYSAEEWGARWERILSQATEGARAPLGH